jgi:undecaprenyl pyrophosphate synthase
VNIFSLSDGKGALVQLTRSICQSALIGQTRSADISQDVINRKLHKEMDIPDPELALICGDVMFYMWLPSLAGMGHRIFCKLLKCFFF